VGLRVRVIQRSDSYSRTHQNLSEVYPSIWEVPGLFQDRFPGTFYFSCVSDVTFFLCRGTSVIGESCFNGGSCLSRCISQLLLPPSRGSISSTSSLLFGQYSCGVVSGSGGVCKIRACEFRVCGECIGLRPLGVSR
jgi:hypothetical protein